jgi:two-component system, cell cycle sensor histidine kinase and response regulator CckA
MFGLLHKTKPGQLLNAFMRLAPVALAELSNDFIVVDCNEACSALLGKDITVIKGSPFTDYIDTASAQSFSEFITPAIKRAYKDAAHHMHLTLKSEKAQDTKNVAADIAIMTLHDTSEPRIFLFLNDVTEQKNLEMRFAHSQKMQAVGQLAGGVAHDFNNLLTAMIGFCDLLLMRHPAGDPSFADIMQIKQNANRAANLVRQLLAFSRRQTLQPKRINLTDLLAELSDLIRRLIGENIELNITHQRDIWAVKVDQGQIEQVIINLAVNARDAMKDKRGRLRIETKNMVVDSLESLDSELRIPPQEETITPGDYVAITISDNGTGIPEHVINNIFEPFFSTKEVGSGTGLGLATVYGIIKQTGGYIYLKTQEDKGTSFTVFIPRMMGEDTKEVSQPKDLAPPSQDLTGAATILLVEDETPVRLFASRALQNKGYEVLEADCGESGLEMYAAHKDKIEVIISDVVMPGINGPTMIETLDANHAESMKNVEVIFISGYAEDAFVDGYEGERTFNFLAKPFTLKQLAAKIKEITDK